jgi:hypothetical protein
MSVGLFILKVPLSVLDVLLLFLRTIMLMVRWYYARGYHTENRGLCYTSLSFGFTSSCLSSSGGEE